MFSALLIKKWADKRFDKIFSDILNLLQAKAKYHYLFFYLNAIYLFFDYLTGSKTISFVEEYITFFHVKLLQLTIKMTMYV